MKNERIITERKKLGLSQEELANKLKISQKSISKYECGTRRPSYETLLAMASLFGVSVDYLLGTENPSSQSANAKRSNGFSQGEHNFFFFFFDESLKDVFVSRLKKSLAEKELSSDEFSETVSFDAEKCNAYLNGKYEPSLEDLVEISQAIDVSIDYLLGRMPSVTNAEKKILNTFAKLDEDNQDIIIGKAKELLKEQRCGSSVAADEKYLDSQGKSLPSSGTGGGTIAV